MLKRIIIFVLMVIIGAYLINLFILKRSIIGQKRVNYISPTTILKQVTPSTDITVTPTVRRSY